MRNEVIKLKGESLEKRQELKAHLEALGEHVYKNSHALCSGNTPFTVLLFDEVWRGNSERAATITIDEFIAKYPIWKPEPGEMIMVGFPGWTDTDFVKREYICMSKNGKHFVCHSEEGEDANGWPIAKPCPKEWYELVSEENPAICWVWDTQEETLDYVIIINDYDKLNRHPFRYGSTGFTGAKLIMWAKDAK